MAGEIDWLKNAVETATEIDQKLRRTADPTERALLRNRTSEALAEVKRAVKALREAADAGERGARTAIDVMERILARDEE